MIPRLLAKKMQQASRQFPIVSLMGPRQSGKTTLVKSLFPRAAYVSFEDPDIRRNAAADLRGFLSSYKKMLIIDEVQRIPEVFSYIQAIVDERGKNGQFIFTGSQNYLLHEKISQSLAGRVAILRLLPLSLSELLLADKKIISPDIILQKGFYPALWKQRTDTALFYSSYINTYLERDVRQIQNISSLTLFQNFIRLCAGRAGQILNLTSLGNDCGISHNTAKAWLSVLESSFIIHLLQPFYENYNKRIVKSPKLYFYDSGLLCHLLDISQPKQLQQHYMKGALMENFIFAELVKQAYNQGQPAGLYYWRDKTGNEVDFLLSGSGYKKLIEVKAGKTINPDFFRGIDYFRKIYKGKSRIKASLIYGGENEYNYKQTQILNWRHATDAAR